MGFAESLREELAPEGIGVTILFPGGMTTRHLESSVLARPAELGESVLDQDDVTAMLAHQPLADGDLVGPDEAIHNLLADLEAGEPYVLTHGSYRPIYEQRRAAMDRAFDRMEAS
jgi:NAD(P)-dependent dehydrogenase (short-subunit alcohol dehydrogenase family)